MLTFVWLNDFNITANSNHLHATFSARNDEYSSKTEITVAQKALMKCLHRNVEMGRLADFMHIVGCNNYFVATRQHYVFASLDTTATSSILNVLFSMVFFCIELIGMHLP